MKNLCFINTERLNMIYITVSTDIIIHIIICHFKMLSKPVFEIMIALLLLSCIKLHVCLAIVL